MSATEIPRRREDAQRAVDGLRLVVADNAPPAAAEPDVIERFSGGTSPFDPRS